jgi:peptidoglycan/xylan/chitin deacetylase (PgdA/CDA1 family)
VKISGVSKFKRAGRWLRSRLVRGGLILQYHRIAEIDENTAPDPFALSLSPRHFAEQLAILRQLATPASLQELTRSLREDKIPQRAVVLTFDDGYADNLYRAKPLLERYQIPATVFAVTGTVGNSQEFWWDELERLLWQPKTLPKELCLTINGQPYQWTFDGEVPERTKIFRDWRFPGQFASGPRLRLFRSLYQLLQSLSADELRGVMERLWLWTGAKTIDRPFHRTLSASEIRELAASGLIEIGAHTVNHPVLARLPAASQRFEIEQSKAQLTAILGRPVTSFAYPYGLPSDYTEESIAAVRGAGFERACSSYTDVAWSRSDQFQLPRLWVRNWDGETFVHRLRMWLRC